MITIVLYGSAILSGSALVEPYLRVDHEVTTPICVQGSEGAPDYARRSTVTITLEGLGDPTPVEVVFAIDYSNTMKISDPKNARLVATKEFIKNLNKSSDRAGLVYWNNSIIESRVVNLTSEFDEIIAKLDKDISGRGVSPEGFTDFNRALNASIDMFSNKSKNTKKCIIFLSDGEPKPQWIPSIYTPPDGESSPVNRAKDAGIQIWTEYSYLPLPIL
ncbi:vWA domain-containing protein [Methanothrix harundinacea]|uniref:vWA domain-containing protein n=1 Tax=Methanothrix harundinacea TaxID=301375 RepID=UPI0016510992|nr:vWA domain-containing protein [Methanothrix harundinacea]